MWVWASLEKRDVGVESGESLEGKKMCLLVVFTL